MKVLPGGISTRCNHLVHSFHSHPYNGGILTCFNWLVNCYFIPTRITAFSSRVFPSRGQLKLLTTTISR